MKYLKSIPLKQTSLKVFLHSVIATRSWHIWRRACCMHTIINFISSFYKWKYLFEGAKPSTKPLFNIRSTSFVFFMWTTSLNEFNSNFECLAVNVTDAATQSWKLNYGNYQVMWSCHSWKIFNAKLFQTNLLETLFIIIEGKFPIHFNEKSQQHFGNLPGSVFSFHTYQHNFLRASKRLNELAYKITQLYLL